MTTNDLYITIGQNICRERQRVGITQRELAEQIGYGRETIVGWEHGRRHIAIDALYAVAAVLGVAPGVLLPDVMDVPAL